MEKLHATNAYYIIMGSAEWDELLKYIDNYFAKREPKQEPTEWVNQRMAYHMLGISNPKTLNEYVGEGIIECSELSSRNVMYRRSSIIKHIELKSFK
ncbi:hypothetical protein [Ekhidna sp.]|jgi:hypothetical protein|uniref:hypothetical protein n=1 Tax=Ekhidna sp. TaxID=2608089 RepID=UPI0032ECC58C